MLITDSIIFPILFKLSNKYVLVDNIILYVQYLEDKAWLWKKDAKFEDYMGFCRIIDEIC